MPTHKMSTVKATTGSSITSLLRASNTKILPGTDVVGGDAAERGSQRHAASRPPDASAQPNTPNTSNTHVANYEKTLSNIETLETALGPSDDVSSLSPAMLRYTLSHAKIDQAHLEAKAVVAARKLPSGDVRVVLSTERAKTALLQDQTWIKCLGRSGSAAEQLYQSVVHSVRVDSLDSTKPADISTLQEQNQTLYPGLRITRAK